MVSHHGQQAAGAPVKDEALILYSAADARDSASPKEGGQEDGRQVE
jgi:hypothetical protein